MPATTLYFRPGKCCGHRGIFGRMALTDDEEAELRRELAELRETHRHEPGIPIGDTPVVIEAPNVAEVSAHAEADVARIEAEAAATVARIEAEAEAAVRVAEGVAKAEAKGPEHAGNAEDAMSMPDSGHWYFRGRKKRRNP